MIPAGSGAVRLRHLQIPAGSGAVQCAFTSLTDSGRFRGCAFTSLTFKKNYYSLTVNSSGQFCTKTGGSNLRFFATEFNTNNVARRVVHQFSFVHALQENSLMV